VSCVIYFRLRRRRRRCLHKFVTLIVNNFITVVNYNTIAAVERVRDRFPVFDAMELF